MKKLFFVFLVCLVSCNNAEDIPEQKKEATYFSVIQYAEDQWETFRGQPFGIVKTVDFNGVVDSSVLNSLEMNWSSVLNVFFETDISDPKYLGEYEFTTFDDPKTITRNFYYKAKNKKLYTQTLHLMIDYFTSKVKSIYIEAKKDTRLGTKDVKLFYLPLETISIQELETSKTGDKKELKIVYEFM